MRGNDQLWLIGGPELIPNAHSSMLGPCQLGARVSAYEADVAGDVVWRELRQHARQELVGELEKPPGTGRLAADAIKPPVRLRAGHFPIIVGLGWQALRTLQSALHRLLDVLQLMNVLWSSDVVLFWLRFG